MEDNQSLEALRKSIDNENSNVSDEQETIEEVEETLDQDSKVDEPTEKEDVGDKSEEQEKEPEEDKSWMNPDDEKEDNGFIPDKTAAAIRYKYKGKIDEQKSEIEELKKKIEILEKSPPPQAPIIKDEPKRADFEDDDLYLKALASHHARLILAEGQSKSVADEKKRLAEQEKQKIAKFTDEHYERAAALCEKSGIKPESYQSADHAFRDAINSVFPGGGDAITDALIANLGPGSEKVIYNVSINRTKREHLISLFKEDPNGIKASVYLGELKGKLTAPARRESQAPDPIDEIKGDKSGGNLARSLKDKFEKAINNGDVQSAFKLKKEAKEKGYSTKSW